MTWMNPKVIVLIKKKKQSRYKIMHTCMSCFIYVNFGKCKLDLAKISLSLAKMAESGVIDAPRVMNSLLSWLQWSFMVYMCPN